MIHSVTNRELLLLSQTLLEVLLYICWHSCAHACCSMPIYGRCGQLPCISAGSWFLYWAITTNLSVCIVQHWIINYWTHISICNLSSMGIHGVLSDLNSLNISAAQICDLSLLKLGKPEATHDAMYPAHYAIPSMDKWLYMPLPRINYRVIRNNFFPKVMCAGRYKL